MFIGLVKVHGLFSDGAIGNKRRSKFTPVHHAVEKDRSGGGPSSTTDQWITDLRDPDSDVRYNAACALAKIGSEAAPAIPALAICLSDEKSYVRSEGVNALRNIGPAAAPAVMLFLSQCNPVNDIIRERLSSFIRNLNEKENILTPEKLSCETRERIAVGTTRILFQDFLYPEFSDDIYLACLLAINDKSKLTKFEDILAKDYSSCDELLKDVNLSLERFLTGKLTNSEMWGVLADEKLSEFGETRFDENIPRFSLYEDNGLKLRERATDLAMQLYEKIVAIYREKIKTPSGQGV